MGKNNKNKKNESKSVNQKPAAKTPEVAPATPKKEEAKKPEQKKPESKAPARKPMNNNEIATQEFAKLHGNMDANHTEDALKLMHTIAHQNPGAIGIDKEQTDSVDRMVYFGVVALISHDVVNNATPSAIVIKKACLEDLKEIASFVGLNLDNAKLLPGKTEEEVIVDPSKATVTEETRKIVETEEAVATEIPELDPEKLVSTNASEEDVNKARIYLAKTRSNLDIPNQILNLVNFEQTFRTETAKKGENAEADLKKYVTYTPANWLQLFLEKTYNVSLLVRSIAKGFAYTTYNYKNPTMAFAMLAGTVGMHKENGKPVFDDQQIADIVKVLATYCAIADREKFIEARDAAKANNNSKVFEAQCELIAKCDKIVEIFNHPNFQLPLNFVTDYKAGDSNARKVYAQIVKLYYPDLDKKKHYKNLVDNVANYIGIITNLFSSSVDRSDQFVESNITELVEYTDEEYQEVRKEELKAEQAKKAAEKAKAEADKKKEAKNV